MLLFLIGGLVKLTDREAFHFHWETFLGILRYDDPGIFEFIRIHWTVFGSFIDLSKANGKREIAGDEQSKQRMFLVTSLSVDISHLIQWPPFSVTSYTKIEIKSKNWTLWSSTSQLLFVRWCRENVAFGLEGRTPENRNGKHSWNGTTPKCNTSSETVMNVADLHRVQVGNIPWRRHICFLFALRSKKATAVVWSFADKECPRSGRWWFCEYHASDQLEKLPSTYSCSIATASLQEQSNYSTEKRRRARAMRHICLSDECRLHTRLEFEGWGWNHLYCWIETRSYRHVMRRTWIFHHGNLRS